MIQSFSFAKIPETVFGAGSTQALEMKVGADTQRILLITGGKSYSTSGIQTKIESVLQALGKKWERVPISGEPSPTIVDEAVQNAKEFQPHTVIAVGGGSVLDAGKAIAAMVKENGSVKDFLEGVGIKQPSGKRLPLIALPTTAGTGSEATKNAVISEFGPEGFKKSLRHNNYVPDVAIIDPELALNCPVGVTAASGLDALTQLIESYLSTTASEMTDALALSGIRRVCNSLLRVVRDGNDLAARGDMAYAAYLSGITLANAGLGAVHGFAQPLGSLFPVPHGVVCGSLMAEVNRITIDKIRESKPDDAILKKYATIGRIMAGRQMMEDADAVDFMKDYLLKLVDELALPKFGDFGISRSDFPKIIAQTGMKNHPVKLDEQDLTEVLESRL